MTVGTHRTAVFRRLQRAARPAARRSRPRRADRCSWPGVAQSNRDTVHAIASRLPLVLTIIAVITLVLVFLLTGSAVLPFEARG